VLISSPYPQGTGGLGRAAEDAADGFAAFGYRVVTPAMPPPSRARRLAGRRPVRRWPEIMRAIERAQLMRSLPGDWEIAWAPPGFLPPRGLRVLHQATFHPAAVRDQVAAARRRAGGGRGFLTAREAALQEGELASADVIRVESEAVRASLVERGISEDKVVHAHPGVDLHRFQPGEKPNELLVAFVGTLSLWKGVDVLVDLAAHLRREETLQVIGGPVDPWSRRLAQEAAFEPANDVPALLSRAHALVLPAASDGFGYVVLEAMASGAVPFVTPTVGAASLVSQLHPELVQPPERFAEAVPELLRSLPLMQLGQEARRLAEGLDRLSCAKAAVDGMLGVLRGAVPA
jgi:glycosyltransferase involved in cell wall biosynthesis